MRARALAIASLTLTAAQSLGCWAINNREGDLDRSPVVNTGAGASIIYPGQAAPAHPGNAAVAASSALSTAAGVSAAKLHSTSPVDGSTTCCSGPSPEPRAPAMTWLPTGICMAASCPHGRRPGGTDRRDPGTEPVVPSPAGRTGCARLPA